MWAKYMAAAINEHYCLFVQVIMDKDETALELDYLFVK